MADIAAAAGMSRPAFYQYFDGRADLFRASFEVLLQDAAEAALDEDGGVADRLDSGTPGFSSTSLSTARADPTCLS